MDLTDTMESRSSATLDDANSHDAENRHGPHCHPERSRGISHATHGAVRQICPRPWRAASRWPVGQAISLRSILADARDDN
jgi:hypothetical protein